MLKRGKLQLLMLRKYIMTLSPRSLADRRTADIYRLPPIPEPDAPQTGIAITTIVKDEAPYLAEWLEFHLMLGVRHIYIYDNGSTDETPDVLAPYIRDRLVTFIPWRNFSMGLNPQRLANTHAFANFGWRYRWFTAIDVDEFLFPIDGGSLEKTLAEFSRQPIISLPWINFGPSDHQTKPNGLVIENYTERAAFPPRPEQYSLLRYKSIVNPREVEIGGGSHHFILRGGKDLMVNDRGEAFAPYLARDSRYASAEKIRLHHYCTRSHEEIERKLAKGRVSKGGKINPNALDRRLAQYELATERDDSILRFVPELKQRLHAKLGTWPQIISL